MREREKGWKLRFVMFTMGYGGLLHDSEELSYDEQYSRKMLSDDRLSIRVEYFNYYMREKFSEDEYEDITIEELKKYPLEIYESFLYTLNRSRD